METPVHSELFNLTHFKNALFLWPLTQLKYIYCLENTFPTISLMSPTYHYEWELYSWELSLTKYGLVLQLLYIVIVLYVINIKILSNCIRTLNGYGIKYLDQFTNCIYDGYFITSVMCVWCGKWKRKVPHFFGKSISLVTAAFENPDSQFPYSRTFIPRSFVVPNHKNYLLEELLLQAVMRT